MAIATAKSRHLRAKNWKDTTGTLFIGIGKSSAWSNDNAPPTPDVNSTGIVEAIGYKQVDVKEFVVQDPSGNIEYLGQTWKILSAEDAATQNSRWIYVKAQINYTELPTTTYRQIGIFSGLQKQSSASGKSALLPAEVANVGVLEVIDNTTPNTRSVNQKDTICYILEF